MSNWNNKNLLLICLALANAKAKDIPFWVTAFANQERSFIHCDPFCSAILREGVLQVSAKKALRGREGSIRNGSWLCGLCSEHLESTFATSMAASFAEQWALLDLALALEDVNADILSPKPNSGNLCFGETFGPWSNYSHLVGAYMAAKIAPVPREEQEGSVVAMAKAKLMKRAEQTIAIAEQTLVGRKNRWAAFQQCIDRARVEKWDLETYGVTPEHCQAMDLFTSHTNGSGIYGRSLPPFSANDAEKIEELLAENAKRCVWIQIGKDGLRSKTIMSFLGYSGELHAREYAQTNNGSVVLKVAELFMTNAPQDVQRLCEDRGETAAEIASAVNVSTVSGSSFIEALQACLSAKI